MSQISRRRLLGCVAGALSAPAALRAFADRVVKNGRLRQSVSRWPYQAIPLPDFCRACADMGLTAIDLLEEADWPVVAQYGLVCSMGYAGGGSIRDGLNVIANHDAVVKNFEKSIPRAAQLKVPNVITFFGNRRGMPDDQATANCVAGLERVKQIAEDHGVTICVELLNSKVNHPDYQGDRTAFGVAIVKAVNSPRVKLLYDIYHMQIMEGDLIRTIRDNHQYIAHYHTGGVPGRHELDATQEVNWATVCRAIVDTGFTGYLAHEFVPTRDPITSLREAVALCDV
ncbi:MAG TPA: TIM barrel protein [Vicinamibacterales bacterium]|nr:TIM barrel protein [Vicinamibacterales bacterium]